jgi:hypothetical protein
MKANKSIYLKTIYDFFNRNNYLQPNFGIFFFILFFLYKSANNFTGLNDHFQFRQTQTAWGIKEVMENGYNFFHLRLPILGYPYEVPFEFPVFQNIAGFFGQIFDLSPEVAGRSTSLLFYCLTGILTYNIIIKLTSASVAFFCTVAFYLTPFSLQWSNAVLMESTVGFFMVLSIIFSIKFFETNNLYFMILSSISLAISALMKITTSFPVIFLIWIILFLVMPLSFRENKFQFFLPFHLIAFFPAFLWTNFADSIKAEGVLTRWLTSENLMGWNFGSIDQRLSVENWVPIFSRFWLLGGLVMLVLVPGLMLIQNRRLWDPKIYCLILLPFIAPLIFFNLFFVHDYYFLAILFPSIFATSLLIKLLLPKVVQIPKRSTALHLAILLLIPTWFLDIPGHDYKAWLRNDRNTVPELSLEIASETLKNDRILVIGCDWNPTILYYADRYGIAAPNWIASTDDAINFVTKNRLVDSPRFIAICGDYLPPDEAWNEVVKRVSKNIWKIE